MPTASSPGGLWAELPIHRRGQYYVRVLADSISPEDVRLTTLECRYPRFIHAEVLRHRVDSHSVESSRAVPTEINIKKVKEDPFVPESFNKRVKGMGVGEALDGEAREEAEKMWRESARAMAWRAGQLNDIGIDKSRANRLLEPFMYVKDIITATEWSNFLALRCPPGEDVDLDFPAQPEFQIFALLVRQALRLSDPKQLQHGWWHLPGATGLELHQLCQLREGKTVGDPDAFVNDLKRACPRRLAKISFDNLNKPEDIEISIAKTGELVSFGHFSPTEHVARPMSFEDLMDGSPVQSKILVPASEISRAIHSGMGNDPDMSFVECVNTAQCWAGNFRGWVQFRKEISGEDDHARLLDYPVF